MYFYRLNGPKGICEKYNVSSSSKEIQLLQHEADQVGSLDTEDFTREKPVFAFRGFHVSQVARVR